MQKITPFLWFDNNLEEALNFYASVFKNTKIINMNRHGADGPVFTATFELEGQRFVGMNGGPMYAFTEAISFVVDCKDQKEIDFLWEQLTLDGGVEGRCGWLKDKFGLSWQIVPANMVELLGAGDAEKNARAMQAMMQMGKLDIAMLKNA